MSAITTTIRKVIPWRRKAKIFRMSTFEKFSAFMLTLLAIFMLLPLIYMFNHALKPYHELFIYPPRIFARDPSFQNFIELLSVTGSTTIPVTRYLFNSILVAVLAVLAITGVSAMAAYPLSKMKFPGSKALFAAIMLTLLFAPETVQIPRYLIASNLGIMNNYFGHILPLVAMPMGVFLMKQFIDQMPNELLDAAKIDGATEWSIFTKIVIPIIQPAVATIMIIAFQTAWGNTETSTLYMYDDEMKTFPFFVSTLTSNMSNNVARAGAAAAASLIMFLPNLLIFLFNQRKVISTMAYSGIK